MALRDTLNFDNNTELEQYNYARKTVDKFVVVLVGAPRGVSIASWVKGMPDMMRRTIHDEINNLTARQRLPRVPWGTLNDNIPEIHICAVTWEYDCVDRYVVGEDTSLGGLDYWMWDNQTYPTPSMNAFSQRHYNEFKINQKFYKKTVDENNIQTKQGLIPIKKDKWEKYLRKHFSWANSVNFSYLDPFRVTNRWESTWRSHNINVDIASPHWAGQMLHFEKAYNDNTALFESLTRNSVVLRIRWDSDLRPFTTLWGFAENILFREFRDKTKSEKPHNMFLNLYDITPVCLVQGSRIVRGQYSAGDYWHGLDGDGAKILGRNWSKWVEEDPIKRMPGYVKFKITEPWDKIHNYNKQPETVMSDFFIDNNYTIYEYHGPFYNTLQSFRTLVTDQWRYEWYEWTEEMVLDLCN
jgi:hypothetical protein